MGLKTVLTLVLALGAVVSLPTASFAVNCHYVACGWHDPDCDPCQAASVIICYENNHIFYYIQECCSCA